MNWPDEDTIDGIQFSVFGWCRWTIEIHGTPSIAYCWLSLHESVFHRLPRVFMTLRIKRHSYKEMQCIAESIITSPWEKMGRNLIASEIIHFVKWNRIPGEQVPELMKLMKSWHPEFRGHLEHVLAKRFPILVANYRVARELA